MLNRYRVVKPYRGFESLRLRQKINNLSGNNSRLTTIFGGHNYGGGFLTTRLATRAFASERLKAKILSSVPAMKLSVLGKP